MSDSKFHSLYEEALAFHQPSSLAYRAEFAKGVTHALSKRDAAFGDYRERDKD